MKNKLLTVLFLLWLTGITAYAAIPAAAKSDARYALGYLVLTYYNVDSTGVTDSRAGIQQAITDAFSNDLALLIPAGTYLVSDVLKCYEWQFWDTAANAPKCCPPSHQYVLIGSSRGAARPIIKLSPSAQGFDNPAMPRPVLVFRYFRANAASGTVPVEPADPLTGEGAGYDDVNVNMFNCELRNIDFDLGGHSGAVGVGFTAAQYCMINGVRVDATGGYAGFWGVPGAANGAANIEVEGGRYGVCLPAVSGQVVSGARFYRQSVCAVTSGITSIDYCPVSIVGFHIICTSKKAVITDGANSWSSALGALTLTDGRIEMTNSGLAIDNSEARNVYVNNVFVTGADSLVKSGSLAAVKGSGTWQHIFEYAYTDQNSPPQPYQANARSFRSFSVVDGVASRTPEPATRIDAAVPPADIFTRHMRVSMPSYEGQNDGTANVRSAGAIPDDALDDWNAIQQAINASTSGRVFLPKGDYIISHPLRLHANTQFFGVTQVLSQIIANQTWVGGASGYMLETDDDSAASTFLGYLRLLTEATAQSNVTAGQVHWRAGRNSMICAAQGNTGYATYNSTQDRHMFHFSGNGGGRHYICPHYNYGALTAGSRQVYVGGTTQPLYFYGLNVEATKRITGAADILTNIEIVGARNVRMYHIKREGHSSTVIIRDSRNIGVFGIGRTPTGDSGAVQIYGTSDSVVVAPIMDDAIEAIPSTTTFMLREALTGKSQATVAWPDNVSLYKRGSLAPGNGTAIESQSIALRANASLSVFPNPIQGTTAVILSSEKGNHNVAVEVLDISGRMVGRIALNPAKNGLFQYRGAWDVKNVSAGLYILKAGAQKKRVMVLK